MVSLSKVSYSPGGPIKECKKSHLISLPTFTIFEDSTETSDNFTEREDIWFDSEVEECNRLVSVYAEVHEYDYINEVLDWLIPYARVLDAISLTFWVRKLKLFRLALQYKVHEYFRGPRTVRKIRQDDTKRRPDCVESYRPRGFWYDNVITGRNVRTLWQFVDAITGMCKELYNRKDLKGQIPEIKYGTPGRNPTFICLYYAGRGSGLDCPRLDSYWQGKGDLWHKIMGVHAGVDMWGDGTLAISQYDGERRSLEWKKNYFERWVWEWLKDDKIDVQLLQSRWRWRHPKTRDYQWQVTRPLANLKGGGNRRLAEAPWCFERGDKENKA